MAHSIGQVKPRGGVGARGTISVAGVQKVNGTHARVTANVVTKRQGDNVRFDLYAVTRTGQQVSLGTVGTASIPGFRAQVQLLIDYNAVQAAIGAAQGANLCLNGVWPTNHKWGMGARPGGAFRLP